MAGPTGGSGPDIAVTDQVNMAFIALIVAVATIGGFMFGYDSGVINGTQDGLESAFNLSALGTGAGDPFGLFEGTGKEQKTAVESRVIRNAERKAFESLSLEVSATPAQVSARYKDLVKRHHPDANGGDRSTEDRLIEIIKAYKYLKSVGMG